MTVRPAFAVVVMSRAGEVRTFGPFVTELSAQSAAHRWNASDPTARGMGLAHVVPLDHPNQLHLEIEAPE